MAQISVGGTPAGWTLDAEERAAVPVFALPALADPQELTAEGGGFRYGIQRDLAVDVLRDGLWSQLPDGRRLGRVLLHSPGAAMISVQFDRWELATGGQVFLYDAAGTRSIGAFNAANRGPEMGMPPGMGMPFCVTAVARARGCHLLGSVWARMPKPSGMLVAKVRF